MYCASPSPLYCAIWNDSYPKKIKLFRWETSHLALNTHDKLQRIMPYMCLSLYWCPLCKQHSESIGHIFVSREFSTKIWTRILNIFGLSVALPTDMPLLLASTLIGHRLNNEKRCIWLHFIWALLWTLWIERN